MHRNWIILYSWWKYKMTKQLWKSGTFYKTNHVLNIQLNNSILWHLFQRNENVLATVLYIISKNEKWPKSPWRSEWWHSHTRECWISKELCLVKNANLKRCTSQLHNFGMAKLWKLRVDWWVQEVRDGVGAEGCEWSY
jgi:hypothetical protein